LVEVDLEGFEREMSGQRERAKQARKGGAVSDEKLAVYRSILDDAGLTTFTGYTDTENIAKIVAVVDGDDDGTVEVFLDVTPFYAESGGQVGDTGTSSSRSSTPHSRCPVCAVTCAVLCVASRVRGKR
jgi:alanyl-tRNA synthetase